MLYREVYFLMDFFLRGLEIADVQTVQIRGEARMM